MNDQIQQIGNFYSEAFQNLTDKQQIPEIEVSFYPYIGISQTIRIRNGKVFVRLAEVCRDIPLDIQKNLAIILVSKLLRKKISANILENYCSFINNQQLREKVLENKRSKGRKIITSAKGDIYNLEEVFDYLNQIYFDGNIKKPRLSWSVKKTYRILGHHDATHDAIVISRSLDGKQTPKYVVEFIVFHEMLHIFHPTQHRNGRRYSHTPQFRRDEKKFAFFNEAELWIKQNIKRLETDAKSK